MYKFWILLRERRNRIWVSSAVSMLLAVALALLAKVATRFINEAHVPSIEAEVIDDLLSVVASSMLAVTIFSLGILVSAYASVAGGATPRATELVMGDDGTRRAIGAFIAAFIYAVVAKIALGLGYYGAQGRFVLLLATLAMLTYLVVRLVLWVRTLSTLGRLPDTLARLEAAAGRALELQALQPFMGAVEGPSTPPFGTPVLAREIGYLTHINLGSLETTAAELGRCVHVRVRPGHYVDPGTCLAVMEGEGACDDGQAARILNAFVISPERTFDQDPRFGLLVLSEVAQRALSPAVNDPGTAIQVMAVLTRLLVQMQLLRAQKDLLTPKHAHLSVVQIDEAKWITDAFAPIGRDGAGSIEIGLRLQHFLAVVARHGDAAMRREAERVSAAQVQRGRKSLTLEQERKALLARHRDLFATRASRHAVDRYPS